MSCNYVIQSIIDCIDYIVVHHAYIDVIDYIDYIDYVDAHIMVVILIIESLVVVPISQASADQRAGRAGRVRSGWSFDTRNFLTEPFYSFTKPF
jgi:hypothetical protein